MPSVEISIPSGNELPAIDEALSDSDREWLIQLGLSWSDADSSDNLLDELNSLIETGSRNLHDATDEDIIDSTFKARQAFFSQLTAIKPETLGSFHGSELLMPLDTFAGTQRVLSEYGINLEKLNNAFPAVMGYKPESVKDKLENLVALGLDPSRVINTHPTIIGYSPNSVRDKMANLRRLGLDATTIITKKPSLLGVAEETAKKRLDNIGKEGIKAAEVVNKFPSVLGYADGSVNAKIRVLYAAARIWHWEDPHECANHIIEQWPTILSYKPAKIRTLVRIALDSFPSRTPEQTLLSDIQIPVILNLEAALVGYLEAGDEIIIPKDIQTVGRRYKNTDKRVLRSIIARHQGNAAVTAYLRGYPLDNN